MVARRRYPSAHTKTRRDTERHRKTQRNTEKTHRKTHLHPRQPRLHGFWDVLFNVLRHKPNVYAVGFSGGHNRRLVQKAHRLQLHDGVQRGGGVNGGDVALGAGV